MKKKAKLQNQENKSKVKRASSMIKFENIRNRLNLPKNRLPSIYRKVSANSKIKLKSRDKCNKKIS